MSAADFSDKGGSTDKSIISFLASLQDSGQALPPWLSKALDAAEGSAPRSEIKAHCFEMKVLSILRGK